MVSWWRALVTLHRHERDELGIVESPRMSRHATYPPVRRHLPPARRIASAPALYLSTDLVGERLDHDGCTITGTCAST